MITIGLSNPADPPRPTVSELVTIWAYICFLGMILAFLATAYKICEVPFSMVPPKTLLTTKTVSKIPMIGKRLLIKLNFKIPLTEVANKKTQCAKVFKTITANAAEIPTNTLDKKINCLLVSLLCDQTIASSSLYMYFLNILFFMEMLKYHFLKFNECFSMLLFCLRVLNPCLLQTFLRLPDLFLHILARPNR